MDLIKCPRCGEEFSSSYRRCPFCEEGDHSRRIKYNTGKNGRHVSDKKQTHSARGAMAGVLVVVLLLLSWSLFGDKIVAKIKPADDADAPGVQDGISVPDDGNADMDDPSGADESNAKPNESAGEATDPGIGDAPDVSDPATIPDNSAVDPGTTTTTPSTPTVDAASLGIKTNVGTTLSKDASGNFDCTIKKSESIKLTVSGTDAAAAWSVADASVLTVSADGKLSPLKTGTTNVTANVGGAALTVIVRVVN